MQSPRHVAHLIARAVILLALAIPVAACGSAESATPDEPMPIDGMGDGNPVTDDQAVEHARGILGAYEDTLPDDVRVGRRGDEHMALTEDYRLGRLTVELDDTDGDGFRVTAVTVELSDGPETLRLEPS